MKVNTLTKKLNSFKDKHSLAVEDHNDIWDVFYNNNFYHLCSMIPSLMTASIGVSPNIYIKHTHSGASNNMISPFFPA